MTDDEEASVGRFGEYALRAADAMDRLKAEARTAIEAYERYLDTLREPR